MGLYPQIVLKHKVGHCARGPKRCEKCKELEKNPQFVYGLFTAGICETPEMAHPEYAVTYIDKQNGEIRLQVCSNAEVRGFKDEKEAKEYAEKNKLQFFIV